MMRILFLTARFVAAALALHTCALAQSFEEKSRQVDSLYSNYGPETPGVSVRVIKDGRIVHRGDYGMASLEHHIPVGPSTKFLIGSNSKQFTAFAVAMLAKEGKIDLDADVRAYVPEVPDFGETITIRQLIHHTSGVRDWVRLVEFLGYSPNDAITLDLIFNILWRQKELNFAPGSRHLYSNTGYVLLAEVIARVTGESYPDWMKKNIFDPLGMTNTQVRETPYRMIENLASSYYPAGNRFLSVNHGLSAYGSCCIVSTTDDMAKWLENFETATLGGEELISAMMNDTVETDEWDGRLVGYGYGFSHFEYKGLKGLFHSGQWVGFRSATLRVPEQNLAIVVLGNNGPSANLKEWDVLDIYASGEASEPASETAGGAEAATIEDLAVDIDEKTLDRYVGTYDFGSLEEGSEILTVKREGDKLVIQFTTDREPSTWTAISQTEFQNRPGGRTLGFDAPGKGPAKAALWRGKSWPRTAPFTPDGKKLLQYVGAYVSDELDALWRFEVEDDALIATQTRWGDGKIIFTPTTTDQFRGDSVVTSARFMRNRRGKVVGVSISGRRTLNVRFDKVERVR